MQALADANYDAAELLAAGFDDDGLLKCGICPRGGTERQHEWDEVLRSICVKCGELAPL